VELYSISSHKLQGAYKERFKEFLVLFLPQELCTGRTRHAKLTYLTESAVSVLRNIRSVSVRVPSIKHVSITVTPLG
jgi:hypothetical protein